MGVLEGKVAVVTGGASGIGLETVRRLQAEGAEVVAVDLQPPPDLGVRFVRADVGDSSAWDAIVGEAESAFGGLDIAFLNAGVTTGNGDVDTVTDEQYRRIMGANVDGVFFGLRAVVPAMERRGGGAVVATASLAGLLAFAPDPVYTATKHAVVGLVRAAAPQLEAKGIRINAVCPGMVRTPLVGDVDEAALAAAGWPMMDPAQIADAVVELVTGTATGQAYVCQAGREPTEYRFGGVPGPR
jgi:NAD(P)-dependent dehydrogenase (short-subunit alcohol dehydrogenase family)